VVERHGGEEPLAKILRGEHWSRGHRLRPVAQAGAARACASRPRLGSWRVLSRVAGFGAPVVQSRLACDRLS